MDLLSKIKKILRWARITKPGNDSGDYPIQQLEYKGKVADSVIIFPYGHHANMPADVLAVIGAVDANAENRIVIGCTPPSRPTLAEGEVAIYHPKTGALIKMNASGDIDITAPTININGDVTITGDATIEGDLAVGAAATDFLTHTHIGSPSAPLGGITPTGIVNP